MLTLYTLECANSTLNRESHWLVNGSFLLTESFCKKYLFIVTSLWYTLVNPFIVVHPTHILVHRAHRLKSAGLGLTTSEKTHLLISAANFGAWSASCVLKTLTGFESHTFSTDRNHRLWPRCSDLRKGIFVSRRRSACRVRSRRFPSKCR